MVAKILESKWPYVLLGIWGFMAAVELTIKAVIRMDPTWLAVAAVVDLGTLAYCKMLLKFGGFKWRVCPKG